jgi:negative regulator of sigma E activity
MKDKLQNELRELLAQLPDAPLPSNFTARILRAVEMEEARRPRKWTFSWTLRALLPRVAIAAITICFAGLAVRQHAIDGQRAAFAKNVALIAGAQPLPGVEALKNFDAIQRMSQPRADEELLALMQ